MANGRYRPIWIFFDVVTVDPTVRRSPIIDGEIVKTAFSRSKRHAKSIKSEINFKNEHMIRYISL
jgi:hypothetical protein